MEKGQFGAIERGLGRGQTWDRMSGEFWNRHKVRLINWRDVELFLLPVRSWPLRAWPRPICLSIGTTRSRQKWSTARLSPFESGILQFQHKILIIYAIFLSGRSNDSLRRWQPQFSAPCSTNVRWRFWRCGHRTLAALLPRTDNSFISRCLMVWQCPQRWPDPHKHAN